MHALGVAIALLACQGVEYRAEVRHDTGIGDPEHDRTPSPKPDPGLALLGTVVQDLNCTVRARRRAVVEVAVDVCGERVIGTTTVPGDALACGDEDVMAWLSTQSGSACGVGFLLPDFDAEVVEVRQVVDAMALPAASGSMEAVGTLRWELWGR